MKILVLGGTRFFGKIAVRYMIERGYEVTLLTRGIVGDDFGNSVERIVVDRTDEVALASALQDKNYDVVFDNIAYVPNDVKVLLDLLGNRVKRYIVTSSLAVYNKGEDVLEEDFNPYNREVTYGARGEFTYAEGKREIEKVIFNDYHIPSVAIRFPIVIGEHDYTRRLYFYVEQILNEKVFAAKDYEDLMSFVTEEDAGRFICSLIKSDFTGPINATSIGAISVKEIIQIVEEQSGKKARVDSTSDNIDPYSLFGGVTQNIHRALQISKEFEDVREAFKRIISYEL